ncbi:MAG: hypothetical protein NTX79_02505 [Candidatus Micrarchaeota archaeon]|nr:hypothetical protein [Candidatus Micrarchaeota archaeon]
MAVSVKKAVKKLTRIGVVSTATTLAAVYAILGIVYALIYIVIIAAVGAAMGSVRSSGIGLAAIGLGAGIMIVAFPVIFAICGFIGGALMVVVYNFVVKYTGGIAFEVSG